MSWFSRHPIRIDPDDLNRKAEESIKKTTGQQAKVNAITTYLENRKNSNGFGEDFEFTLRPKGA